MILLHNFEDFVGLSKEVTTESVNYFVGLEKGVKIVIVPLYPVKAIPVLYPSQFLHFFLITHLFMKYTPLG